MLQVNELYIRSVSLEVEADDADYPFNLPIVGSNQNLQFNKPITIIVGENGTGKSTLIEAIAVAYGFNPEGGSKNFNFTTSGTHSQLHEHIKLVKGIKKPRDGYFLRAESFYNVASNIEALDSAPSFSPPVKTYYGGRSLHEMSHGESFISLLNHRLGGKGLYIFDEPEAALSPQRQLELVAHIKRLAEAESQLIIATHSPIVLATPEAEIWSVGADGSIHITTYQQTDHFKLSRDFLNHPDTFLRELLK